MPADPPCYSLPSTDALRSLEVDPQTGLSDDEVKSRREQYGTNELHHAQRRSIWLILLEQFKSVVIIILALMGIAAVVIVNTLIGFFAEYKAARSMETLRELGVQKS